MYINNTFSHKLVIMRGAQKLFLNLSNVLANMYRSVYNRYMNTNTNSRNTILQCALQLFGERGYESVGINEITQMAGITKPTLYYFFQSKEGVFKVILEEYYGRFNRLLHSACYYVPDAETYDKDVYPVFIRIVEMYFSFAKENTTFYLMLLSLSFAPPTAQTTIITRPYVQQQYQTVKLLFEEIANIHTNLKGHELEYASHLIALINANIGFWFQGLGEINTIKAKRIVQQFMHGIFS